MVLVHEKTNSFRRAFNLVCQLNYRIKSGFCYLKIPPTVRILKSLHIRSVGTLLSLYREDMSGDETFS